MRRAEGVEQISTVSASVRMSWLRPLSPRNGRRTHEDADAVVARISRNYAAGRVETPFLGVRWQPQPPERLPRQKSAVFLLENGV